MNEYMTHRPQNKPLYYSLARVMNEDMTYRPQNIPLFNTGTCNE